MWLMWPMLFSQHLELFKKILSNNCCTRRASQRASENFRKYLEWLCNFNCVAHSLSPHDPCSVPGERTSVMKSASATNISSRLLGIIILSCDFIKRPLDFNQAPSSKHQAAAATAATATGKCRRLWPHPRHAQSSG